MSKTPVTHPPFWLGNWIFGNWRFTNYDRTLPLFMCMKKWKLNECLSRKTIQMCVMLFQFCMIISSLPSLRQPFHPTAMKKLLSYVVRQPFISAVLPASIMDLRLDLKLDLNDLSFASDLHKNTHKNTFLLLWNVMMFVTNEEQLRLKNHHNPLCRLFSMSG